MDGRAGQIELQTGDRLPAVRLPSVATGRPVSLREPAAGAAAILVLPTEPGRFAAYARTFAAQRNGYTYWAGRPIVLVPGGLESAAGAAAAAGLTGDTDHRINDTTVLVDVDGALRRDWNAPDGEAMVIIADRWGEVYAALSAPDPNELPGPDAVDEWLRFLSTQCPECGVIDEPGLGEWTIG